CTHATWDVRIETSRKPRKHARGPGAPNRKAQQYVAAGLRSRAQRSECTPSIFTNKQKTNPHPNPKFETLIIRDPHVVKHQKKLLLANEEYSRTSRRATPFL
ncbi:unnamed protein product, partial [Ectocarpus sp. 12 AP-2014]